MLATSSMNNKERDYKAYRSIPSNYKYYPRQNSPRKLAKPQKENQAAFNKTGTRHIKTKTIRPHNREPKFIQITRIYDRSTYQTKLRTIS